MAMHDEAERERDADLAEPAAFGVDHDRAAAEEDERKCPERLRAEQPSAVGSHGLTQRR